MRKILSLAGVHGGRIEARREGPTHDPPPRRNSERAGYWLGELEKPLNAGIVVKHQIEHDWHVGLVGAERNIQVITVSEDGPQRGKRRRAVKSRGRACH